MSILVRPSHERGHAEHGWLSTRYSFSFADYYDPAHMGFRALRVINEDVIRPGSGFGTHGHADMEIVTYMVAGTLAHKDSAGHQEEIRRGEVQHMSAGTGILHSEFNPSSTEPAHLLQIWLLPARRGVAPGYQQALFSDEDKRNRLRLIVSPHGDEGSLPINQDARIHAGLLDADVRLTHALAPGRAAWVQVVTGGVTVNGQPLGAGDGAAVEGVERLEVVAVQPSEILLFDLA